MATRSLVVSCSFDLSSATTPSNRINCDLCCVTLSFNASVDICLRSRSAFFSANWLSNMDNRSVRTLKSRASDSRSATTDANSVFNRVTSTRAAFNSTFNRSIIALPTPELRTTLFVVEFIDTRSMRAFCKASRSAASDSIRCCICALYVSISALRRELSSLNLLRKSTICNCSSWLVLVLISRSRASRSRALDTSSYNAFSSSALALDVFRLTVNASMFALCVATVISLWLRRAFRSATSNAKPRDSARAVSFAINTIYPGID
ncbi:28.8 kDa [Spodoptera frugiperda ascovirus 1a]|uniref:28.8 kDa n=1 Tax=Spodoptera frugiperda ascovirus 1a TaxID=113370 RepID=Q0E556_SFAVA|nr:28.8 kDa [Spodoptera frugiperda ascovirus 1a]CAL44645.1 28.8 kDa [Spodoptera frugiperda ascovirus 1a]